MINYGKGLGDFYVSNIYLQMTSIISPKLAMKFYCEKCNYPCSKKSDYEKHLYTRKHKILTNTSGFSLKVAEYVCDCGKQYKHRQSLNNHKKKCIYKKPSHDTEITVEPIMEYLLKENVEMKKDNLEMKKMMIDLCKNMGPTNITNNNNKNFNINIFLNEECKDAMNLTDFVDSIQLSIEDMKYFGDQGQVNGMANILIDKLNAMDIIKRPMHCSDIKKETIYIKDEDKWAMEEKSKPNIKNALDSLTNKSIHAMSCLENNPDAYVKTISEVLKDPREDSKIISKLAKVIIV